MAAVMWTSLDRWTCGACNRTVVIDASAEDTAAAIAAVQVRHYRAHRDAAVTAARLRETDVDKAAQRWGAA